MSTRRSTWFGTFILVILLASTLTVGSSGQRGATDSHASDANAYGDGPALVRTNGIKAVAGGDRVCFVGCENVRSAISVLLIKCFGVSTGFTGQSSFRIKSRYSSGGGGFVRDGNGTTTEVGNLTGVNVQRDTLYKWSVTISITDKYGTVVAADSESGGRENSSLNATVTAIFGTMRVTASLEWYPLVRY